MTAVLIAREVQGAIIIGIVASTVLGLATGLVHYQGLFSLPPSIAPTLLQLDVARRVHARR